MSEDVSWGVFSEFAVWECSGGADCIKFLIGTWENSQRLNPKMIQSRNGRRKERIWSRRGRCVSAVESVREERGRVLQVEGVDVSLNLGD